MIPLIAVSGRDCAAALAAGGFIRSRSGGAIVLSRGGRTVVVPDVPMLSPDDLKRVLRDAALAYGDFLDLIGESPTDPGVARRYAPRVAR